VAKWQSGKVVKWQSARLAVDRTRPSLVADFHHSATLPLGHFATSRPPAYDPNPLEPSGGKNPYGRLPSQADWSLCLMVKIRLQRLGRRNRPFYRVVAIDHLTRREGACLENLGFYDPCASQVDKQVRLNDERVKHWLSYGAQPSDTVRDLLAKRGLIDVKLWEKDREHQRKRLAEKLAKAPAVEEKKK